MRLTAAHRLVQSPQRPRTGVLGAAAEPYSDLRHQIGEQRTRVRNLAVVRRSGVCGALIHTAIDGLEQRHLYVVDRPGRVNDLIPDFENLPPGCHLWNHWNSSISGITSNRLPCRLAASL